MQPRAEACPSVGTAVGEPSSGPTVTFVLPVHRDGPAFRRALAAAQACDPPADEIVVAVDGPHPDLVAVALEHGARVVQLSEGRGPAVARNAGASVATGDLLFFVDADVVVPPDVVAVARRYLTENADVHAVIGTYDDEPDSRNFFSQYKNLLNHHVHQRAHHEGCTFWGACGVIRRATFERLGGFDPRYRRPTVEDIELGYRLKAAGDRIHVVKTLQVKHLKRWTAGSVVVTDIRDRALPWSALILRTGRLPDDLNVDRRSRLAALLAPVLVLGLLAALLHPAALAVAALAFGGLLALDAPLLGFLRRRRGAWFALRAVPSHVLYHLYSGASFAAAVGHQLTGFPVYRWRRRRAERARARAGAHRGSRPVAVPEPALVTTEPPGISRPPAVLDLTAHAGRSPRIAVALSVADA